MPRPFRCQLKSKASLANGSQYADPRVGERYIGCGEPMMES